MATHWSKAPSRNHHSELTSVRPSVCLSLPLYLSVSLSLSLSMSLPQSFSLWGSGVLVGPDDLNQVSSSWSLKARDLCFSPGGGSAGWTSTFALWFWVFLLDLLPLVPDHHNARLRCRCCFWYMQRCLLFWTDLKKSCYYDNFFALLLWMILLEKEVEFTLHRVSLLGIEVFG